MGRNAPPTVEIIANDMVVNNLMSRIKAVELIRDGWILVVRGTLLVNERVFPERDSSDFNAYKGVLRPVQHTVKASKRDVEIRQDKCADIFPWRIGREDGGTGGGPAGTLKKSFESPNVKLTWGALSIRRAILLASVTSTTTSATLGVTLATANPPRPFPCT